jgi:hypothetical protein
MIEGIGDNLGMFLGIFLDHLSVVVNNAVCLVFSSVTWFGVVGQPLND